MRVLLLLPMVFAALILLAVTQVANATDIDSDGFDDSVDDCPLAAGNSTLDRTGCPDRDGDGNSDWTDRWSVSDNPFLNVQSLSTNYDYYSVDHSPDGELVVSGDENGNVQIWNTTTHVNILSVESGDGLGWEVAWSDDGAMIAASNMNDDELNIWWANNMTPRHSAIDVDVGSNDNPKKVAFNPDGDLIAVAVGRSGSQSTNGQVKIINTLTGVEERSLNPNGEDRFASVAWSPDGSRIAMGGTDDVWIYETVNWQINHSLIGIADNTVIDLAWSPDGNYLSVCETWNQSGSKGSIIDVHTGVEVWEKNHSTSCTSTDFSPDSRMVAFSLAYYSTDGNSVRIYDTISGFNETTFSGPRPDGCLAQGGGNNCGSIYGLSWSPDGQHFVTSHGRNDEGLNFWQLDFSADNDNDGISNWADDCRDTPEGAVVDTVGCAESQLDDDHDGITNDNDDCDLANGNATMSPYIGCPDQDGDGYADVDDAFVFKPSQWRDSDGDGLGDNWDGTVVNRNGSNDGIGEYWPNAYLPDPSPLDYDNDGFDDSTLQFVGAAEPYDDCPLIYGTSTEDVSGCVDSDGDGWSDSSDSHPGDGTQHNDTDGDGYGDDDSMGSTTPDACPLVSGNSTFDRYGCPDSDGDGMSDNGDAFPNDSNETTDSDGDGIGDEGDAFSEDSNRNESSNGPELLKFHGYSLSTGDIVGIAIALFGSIISIIFTISRRATKKKRLKLIKTLLDKIESSQSDVELSSVNKEIDGMFEDDLLSSDNLALLSTKIRNRKDEVQEIHHSSSSKYT